MLSVLIYLRGILLLLALTGTTCMEVASNSVKRDLMEFFVNCFPENKQISP